MRSEKWQCLDHPNRVWQLIPKSCHCHRETAVTVPDGLFIYVRLSLLIFSHLFFNVIIITVFDLISEHALICEPPFFF